MPDGFGSSGAGRGIRLVTGGCCCTQPASRVIAAIDRRFIVRFPPERHLKELTGHDNGTFMPREGTAAMPHLKLRDDAELYYETHGSGPPLFLVPGLGGDGRFWGDHVAALAQEFTVVVHDHRGTARSTLSKITYSVEQMADDALQ